MFGWSQRITISKFSLALVAMASLTLVLWVTVLHFCTAHAKLQDLLVATARGGFALREFLAGNVENKALLSSKDEFGFSSLTVAAYNGDWQAAEELLKHGALLTPGEITVSMREGNVNVGSVVELMVRRSSMLIMLGTGVWVFMKQKSPRSFRLSCHPLKV